MASAVQIELGSVEDKRQLLTRVANSILFRRAPRLREFLLYAGECTLNNRLEDVREQVIAEKVFQRKADVYDLQDSIVRAEARNLRKRLERYFETEGVEERLVISMPKGGYSLAFQLREPAVSGDVSPAAAPLLASRIVSTSTTSALAVSAPAGLAPKLSNTTILSIACVLLGLAAIFAGALAAHWHSVSADLTNSAAHGRKTLPFSSIFDGKQETLIVTSDTGFLQICQLAGTRLSLDQYLVRSYPDIPRLNPPGLLPILNHSQFTDAAEVTIAGLILKRNAPSIERTFLRSGRQVELADFKRGNVILLGSPLSNPWAQLYADRLNFQFDPKASTKIEILNRSPLPGELPRYSTPADTAMNHTFAQLVFIPNASGSGSVLLIAGTTAEATGAAGEFLLNEAQLSATLKGIGIDPAGPPRYFELLLRANTFIGGATHSELIAFRLHPYSKK